jgi:hypothetical protein
MAMRLDAGKMLLEWLTRTASETPVKLWTIKSLSRTQYQKIAGDIVSNMGNWLWMRLGSVVAFKKVRWR